MILAKVRTHEAEQAVAMLDEIISRIDSVPGIDRSALVTKEEYGNLQTVCDTIAQEHGKLLESQGRSVHPTIEIEVPAIIADRLRKERTKRMLE